ncbi:hypothetical protein N7491_009459 [Penicillium cf. griseofulvum]|uniref:Uncharacterized protein n=1 Tax=Penicillium cf. griseofulvum TaxID=2972120 RepID=A0A9W9JMP6_9EURO|nr:hypothetical protein N7472_004949 [Penicillium cf. griseofulvum]KAJ5424243.1 hypothetical protein N7491_009459 [Penicillium cf. griseofulvum]KAJ5442519.1 hypothetical protein N7445_005526 [Penicillium cf. griseofulvum]
MNKQLWLTRDVNATMQIEVISTPTKDCKVSPNGVMLLNNSKISNGKLLGTVTYNHFKLDIPDLANLWWKFLGSRPEIQASYCDSAGIPCIRSSTHNPRAICIPRTPHSMHYGTRESSSRITHSSANESGQVRRPWLFTACCCHSPRRMKAYMISVMIDHMGRNE